MRRLIRWGIAKHICLDPGHKGRLLRRIPLEQMAIGIVGHLNIAVAEPRLQLLHITVLADPGRGGKMSHPMQGHIDRQFDGGGIRFGGRWDNQPGGGENG